MNNINFKTTFKSGDFVMSNNKVRVLDSTFNELVNKYDREIVLNNFEVTAFSDETMSLRYAEALLTKLEFDAAYVKTAPKMTGEFVKIHKTRQGVETKVVINFDSGTVSVLKQDRDTAEVYNTREYVILNFKASAKPELDNDVVSGIYKVHAALYLLVRAMPRARSTGELDNLLSTLVSKVFVDTSIQNIVNNKSFYGRRSEVIEGQKLDQQGLCIATEKFWSLRKSSLTKIG